ncbi:VWA domain-containing protein [Rhodobacteraceae bacterium NNCM2]|nr:VWA domain-containing protein [Coraliihabitans acroporae]
MFLKLFFELKDARLPVSLREHLTLVEAMDAGLVIYDIEEFYYLARAALVKDERHLDRFDRVFTHVFKGIDAIDGQGISVEETDIPTEWLQKLAEKHLTDEEKALVESLGGWEKLMETLQKRLEEQKGRHQGGNKWIGTAGTSPFGAYGYNPEGIRIGQKESRHRRAVKVWDKRQFKDLDGDVELGTRNIKVALKRLRRWARDGAEEELDLDGTIRGTAEKGYLDVKLRPERRNAVKVLMLFDIGGSMDDHIRVVEELFSAAKTEFKHLEYYYFHNCLYEGVWRNNARRWTEQTPTQDVLNTYGSDYKLVFVGDASMSPYEILYPGGASEHWNAEPGEVWLRRALDKFPSAAWINPVPQARWQYTHSVGMINQIMDGRMFPMTLTGLDAATRELSR